MDTNELKEILEKHKEWASGRENGERADLSGADLHEINLCDAILKGADLRGASLHGVNLSGATLYYADLRGTNLRGLIYVMLTYVELVFAARTSPM